MTHSGDLMVLLEPYFANYSIAPILGGATEADLYQVTTNQNERYILKKQVSSLQNDFLNYKWLERKVPVPQVIFYAQYSNYEWLCTTELKGQTLDSYIDTLDKKEIISYYAKSLKWLHSLTIDGNSLVQNLNERLLVAEYNYKNNLVDRSQLQPQYQQYNLGELYTKLLAMKPVDFELVFTHGDYCLDNIIYHNGELSGFIDLGNGGVADKYQDIAIAVRTIQDDFGDEFVSLFYQDYGLREINNDKLAFYMLLDEFF